MSIPYTLCNHGIQVDMLGQPLHVGDLILLKGYGEYDKRTFATITKVNRKTVAITAIRRYYNRGKYHPNPFGVANWNYYPDAHWVEKSYNLKRAGHDVLKLPPTFRDEAQLAAQQVIDAHPEIFI